MENSNEKVGKALDLLRTGLQPFVEREMRRVYKDRWAEMAAATLPVRDASIGRGGALHLDVQGLLTILSEHWNQVFSRNLGRTERSYVNLLRDDRNRWAHQHPFSTRDVHRALDGIHRLLLAIHADEAAQVDRMLSDLEQAPSNGKTARDRSADRRAGRPTSKPRRPLDTAASTSDQAVWDAIRGLEGRTLLTTSRRRPFDVVQVTDSAVVVEPHSTRQRRRVAYADFGEAIRTKSLGNELRPSDVQSANESTRNSSYVVAMLRAIE